MALTAEDIQTIEQMIDERSAATAADTLAELTPEQIRRVVRQVLDDDGASVDNYDEVPAIETLTDDMARLWSMPLVRRTLDGLAQEYRQTPLDALSYYIAKQIEDKYPESEAAYNRIKEILISIDGLEAQLNWATYEEVEQEMDNTLNT